MGHEERLHVFLTSATVIGGKWSRSQYSDLTSTGTPNTQLPGG
jgi:hypothetical protein